MRTSIDIVKDGHVFSGFDYELQLWVENGIVLDCGHPDEMKAANCCDAHKYAGKLLKEVIL